MQSTEKTVEAYLNSLPEDRQAAMRQLRACIANHIPPGVEEQMSYGMIGYVVPHSLYSKGYHCTPELPLPFLNIASQKNHIALYHMYLYSNPTLYNWFKAEYEAVCKHKLDMGKSCIRFKKIADIPYNLIAQLAEKVTVAEWIRCYDEMLSKRA